MWVQIHTEEKLPADPFEYNQHGQPYDIELSTDMTITGPFCQHVGDLEDSWEAGYSTTGYPMLWCDKCGARAVLKLRDLVDYLIERSDRNPPRLWNKSEPNLISAIKTVQIYNEINQAISRGEIFHQRRTRSGPLSRQRCAKRGSRAEPGRFHVHSARYDFVAKCYGRQGQGLLREENSESRGRKGCLTGRTKNRNRERHRSSPAGSQADHNGGSTSRRCNDGGCSAYCQASQRGGPAGREGHEDGDGTSRRSS